jgi:hypothetical protein
LHCSTIAPYHIDIDAIDDNSKTRLLGDYKYDLTFYTKECDAKSKKDLSEPFLANCNSVVETVITIVDENFQDFVED